MRKPWGVKVNGLRQFDSLATEGSRGDGAGTSTGPNPLLSQLLKLRAPYMDPLNHLQVELLKRYRAGETDERLANAIHLTINGIASGLRNTG